MDNKNNEGNKDFLKSLFSFLVEGGKKLGLKVFFMLVLIFVFALVIFVILLSVPTSLLFVNDDSKEKTRQEISYNMAKGFNEVIEDTKDEVYNYAKEMGCDGNMSNLSLITSEDGNLSYSYNSKYCEINFKYSPEVSAYGNEVTGYIVAYNGAITLLDGESELTDEYQKGSAFMPSQNIFDSNKEGFFISDYTKDILGKNEYGLIESDTFIKNIKQYAKEIFEIDDFSKWINDIKTIIKTENKIKKVCYLKGTASDKEVPCNGTYDYSEEVEYSENYEVKVGDVSININYDISKYKPQEIDNCINNLIGEKYYDYASSGDNGDLTLYTYDREKAKDVVYNTIQNFYMQYIFEFNDFDYTSGYIGSITSNGFDYSRVIYASDKNSADIFWRYSNLLKEILCDLEYKTDSFGGPPIMTRQCTQFASTWFYDTYGFSALRGNGDMMAFNIVKDCGKDSSCPIKFALSNSPSPGAIMSLSPNHVAVINEVKEDGSIVVCQGNVKGGNIETGIVYKNINDYCAKNGKSLKAMAIPIKD